jgi:diguanylate cyclase (GGDEF)-like protein/PAS domain S-box-containing protein
VSSSSPFSAERIRLSWSYVFGVHGAGGDSFQALTDARAAAMDRRRPAWLAAQAIAALCIVPLLQHSFAGRALFPWVAAILGLVGILAITAHRIRIGGQRHASWFDADAIGGLLFGCGWAVALALFTGRADSLTAFTMLAIAGSLCSFATVMMAPAPSGGVAFLLTAGAGAVTAMAVSGGIGLALVIVFFLIAIAFALLFNAHAMLRRIAAEQALAEKEGVISLLLREFEDSGADWLWRIDAAKCLIDVTPRLSRLFGQPKSAIEGRPLLALLAGEDWEGGRVAPPIRALAEKLRLRESFRDLIVPVTIGGERRWWSLSAAPRRDERGTLIGFWGVGTDVTERQRSDERIDRMARFDALTGLANRAHIIDRLNAALRDGHHEGRRAALMLIDLDRFKQINDTLGHPVGDRLLIEVATRLSSLVDTGDLCGRLGGDEFAVVINDASDRDRVESLAGRIVTTLGAPYEIEDHRLHIGASVGSATSPRDGRAVDMLLRNADLALYRAKDDGRGIHRRYEPQLHAHAERRRTIELALRDALERGELRLVYQPIVEAGQGQLAGFEALLRWHHPELGAVSPDIFIPIAEEARLIGRIGDWVMHTACRDAAAWPSGVRVAVNMAAAQLRDPQLPATIVSALSHSGLAAERLELEITEEVFVRDGAAMAEMVDRILSLGVRIALDDFGTGRSTLGYLRKGRFSTVKIDRSFVRGAAGNAAESIAIVRAIVAMADSLGMTTIAEGAETRDEYDRMRGLGCRQIQGWMVGQPVDGETAGRMAADAEVGRKVA